MSDGSSQELIANIITESMFAQIDSEGHHYQLLQEITNHRKDRSEIPISDDMIRLHNGNMVPKKKNKGWDLLMEWMDGSSSWIHLTYLKTSDPVELAKYWAGKRLDVEPAYKWLVRYMLRLRNRIISTLKSKYWRTTQKFGIQFPKSVDEALSIGTSVLADRKSENTSTRPY